MTLVTGNTYPVKDQIKRLGGKWDADVKGWMVPDDKAEQAKQLVAGAGPKKDSRPACAACGRRGYLHEDLEDGLDKCYGCCDMPA